MRCECGCDPAEAVDGIYCRTTGVQLDGPRIVCFKYDHIGPPQHKRATPAGRRAQRALALRRAEASHLGLPRWTSAVAQLYPNLDPHNSGVGEALAKAIRGWSSVLSIHRMTYPCLTGWPLLFTAVVTERMGVGAMGRRADDILLPRCAYFTDHPITPTVYRVTHRIRNRSMSMLWKQIKLRAMTHSGVVRLPFRAPPQVLGLRARRG